MKTTSGSGFDFNHVTADCTEGNIAAICIAGSYLVSRLSSRRAVKFSSSMIIVFIWFLKWEFFKNYLCRIVQQRDFDDIMIVRFSNPHRFVSQQGIPVDDILQ